MVSAWLAAIFVLVAHVADRVENVRVKVPATACRILAWRVEDLGVLVGRWAVGAVLGSSTSPLTKNCLEVTMARPWRTVAFEL